MAGAGKSSPGYVVANRVGNSQIEAIFRDFFRDRDFHIFARDSFKFYIFRPEDESHFRVLLQVAEILENTYGTDAIFDNPQRVSAWFSAEVTSFVSSAINEYSPSAAEGVTFPGLLLDKIFLAPEEELNTARSKEYLQLLLQERLVQNSLRDFVVATSHGVSMNFEEILQGTLRKHKEIMASDLNPLSSIAPEGWEPRPLEFRDTGIGYFNRVLGGGAVGGEVYGILAPTGGGKTTQAVQLICAFAEAEVGKKMLAEAQGEQYEPMHAVLFHYEASLDEARGRVWSCLSKVHIDTIRNYDPETLSSTRNGVPFKQYEHELFRDVWQFADPATREGELERIQRCVPLHAPYMHLVDMGDTRQDPKRGKGYVQEIADYIERWLVNQGKKVGLVVIDYAGVCVKRHIAYTGKSHEQLRHLLGDFGDNAKEAIALKFDVPVFVYHQTTFAETKRSPAAKLHHSDSAEAKNFGENMAFCFCLGVATEQEKCLQMHTSKARRTTGHPPVLLRISGKTSRLEDASNQFYLDPNTGQIMPRTEAGAINSQLPPDVYEQLREPAMADTGFGEDTNVDF